MTSARNASHGLRLVAATCLALAATASADPQVPADAAYDIAAERHVRFDGPTGRVRAYEIPIAFVGRMTIGDLNSDGQPDFVVSNRDSVAAYDASGDRLWQTDVGTNWDYPPDYDRGRHNFWHWSSYGYVGDADGDGDAEFLHIGDDWRTVYIRNGADGLVENRIVLSDDLPWMFVFLARRAGESGETATRVIVTTPAYYGTTRIEEWDVRSGAPERTWSVTMTHKELGNVAYITPRAANLDAARGDEIFFGGLALSETGDVLWHFNASGLGLGGAHTLQVRDFDPDLPGLEATFSIYQPVEGKPSIVAYAHGAENAEIGRAFSFNQKVRHPHQHVAGDFDLERAGLEVLSRSGKGFDHWFTDIRGNEFKPDWRPHPGWDDDGEYVYAIEWDEQPGTEVLYLKRHVPSPGRPPMRVVSPHTDTFLTPIFGDATHDDPKSWSAVADDNPYEAQGHTVDLFGDGREEILTWGDNAITIYYNSGDAGVPSRWGDADYMMLKKSWCQLYNPR